MKKLSHGGFLMTFFALKSLLGNCLYEFYIFKSVQQNFGVWGELELSLSIDPHYPITRGNVGLVDILCISFKSTCILRYLCM